MSWTPRVEDQGWKGGGTVSWTRIHTDVGWRWRYRVEGWGNCYVRWE